MDLCPQEPRLPFLWTSAVEGNRLVLSSSFLASSSFCSSLCWDWWVGGPCLLCPANLPPSVRHGKGKPCMVQVPFDKTPGFITDCLIAWPFLATFDVFFHQIKSCLSNCHNIVCQFRCSKDQGQALAGPTPKLPGDFPSKYPSNFTWGTIYGTTWIPLTLSSQMWMYIRMFNWNASFI